MARVIRNRPEPFRWLKAAAGAVLVVAVLTRLLSQWCFLREQGVWWQYPSFGFSEFLINFEGGFVRRGLLGQLLYRFSAISGHQPGWPVVWACYAAWVAATAFFAWRFRCRRWSMLLLLTPLMMGYTGDIIRKDFLLFLLTGLAIWLLSARRSGMSALAAGLLSALGIFLHEAFIFWGAAAITLTASAYGESGRERVLRALLAGLPPLAAFTACACNAGDLHTAGAITASWESLFPGIGLDVCENSISALGWTPDDAARLHILRNFTFDYNGTPAWTWRLPVMFAVYYLLVNAQWVLKRKKSAYTEEDRTNLGCAAITMAVCLLPMLTVLSCDYERVYQYLCISAVAMTVMMRRQDLRRVFPRRMRSGVEWFNRRLDRAFTPSICLILLLMVALPPSFPSFDPGDAVRNTPIWQIFHLL